ncbi:DUF7344 domain-containing protein [Salinigranum sp. GCM10025319]|uniref:DUF7344 domain-containing protein n=1 Tax=Salinigranum sp. GCM10025319 TaxID=3252687 RepID=UPI00361485F6
MERPSGPTDGGGHLLRELVSSPQRRNVVRYLADSDEAATFDDIVDALSDGSERRLTAIRLHHVHLPKLAAAGAVDWETDAGVVRLNPVARRTLDSVGDSGLFGRIAGD